MADRMLPFITGSHAYGVPTEKSDYDLFMLVDAETYRMLKEAADSEDGDEKQSDSESQWSASLRFGKLNLLVTTDQKFYMAWRDGTKEMVGGDQLITRDEAIKVLTHYEERYGFSR